MGMKKKLTPEAAARRLASATALYLSVLAEVRPELDRAAKAVEWVPEPGARNPSDRMPRPIHDIAYHLAEVDASGNPGTPPAIARACAAFLAEDPIR